MFSAGWLITMLRNSSGSTAAEYATTVVLVGCGASVGAAAAGSELLMTFGRIAAELCNLYGVYDAVG